MKRVRNLSAWTALLPLLGLTILVYAVAGQQPAAGQDRQTAAQSAAQEKKAETEIGKGQSQTLSAAPKEAAAGADEMFGGSQIIGASVVGPKGEKLGKLSDLALDATGSHVVYAVLSHGGGLMSSPKLFAVPWTAMEMRIKQQGEVRIAATPETLDQATGFDPSRWPDTADSMFGSVTQHAEPGAGAPSGLAEDRPDAAKPGAAKPDAAKPAAAKPDTALGAPLASQETASRQAGQSAGSAAAPARILKASEMIGVAAQDSAGQKLGKIEELALDPRTGHVAYDVVSSGGYLGVGAKRVAVPVDAVVFQAKDGTAVLNVKREQIEKAPALEGKTLPKETDLGWIRSSGT
jgi:sporulation protein YlmC with PRC-barrel domain